MSALHDDTITAGTVARVQAGDATAITAIYQRYTRPLFGFIVRRVGDAAVAEDLLQDVFVRMLAGLPQYEERGYPIGAWLYRMAACRVIDWQRVAQRRCTVPLDQAGPLASPDGLDGAHSDADQVAQQRELAAALTTLTARQAAVIRLRFLAELPINAVAQRLGLTPQAVNYPPRKLVGLRLTRSQEAIPSGHLSAWSLWFTWRTRSRR